MDVENSLSEQKNLAVGLMEIAGRGWSRVFVNCEARLDPEGIVISVTGFYVVRSMLGAASRHELPLDFERYDLLKSVCTRLMEMGNVSALTVDCIVRKDGMFQYFVDYSAPLRLSGDVAASGRFLRYRNHDDVLARLARAEESKSR